MKLKLFSKSKPLTYDDMKVADPNRTPTDFSDPAYQHNTNIAAGYNVAGTTDRSQDGQLVMWTEGDTIYRAQNGKLYTKAKK